MANPIEMKAKLPAIVSGANINAIVPANVGEMMQLAEMLAKSEMVPKGYVNKPQDIVVSMMFGMELGLPPLASLRHVAVINGKPSLYGDGQLGVAMGKGSLENIEEKIEGEGDNQRAVCTVKRKGMVSPVTRTFSMADAKRAGLAGKQGPWSQYPKRMLQMRARSFALRDAFPDYLLGMSAEEARDVGVGPDNARDVTPSDITPPESRLAAMEAAIAGEPEPMPTDTNFGLPMTWPAPTADRKAWIAAAASAAEEIAKLETVEGCEHWMQLNADGVNLLMERHHDVYERLYAKWQDKREGA